ncbi:hypothetical protein CPB83DRAFT_893376 [Crepidotus variabilis]|uniref:Uncharacterized protein n=1 Tax=Crepidotus variabilis TaxID=179855 RepID=A0A9P6JQE9_9AGAR|nr:hypothetical protein CPB83DRAFT_893376 [Crepidotus variabilis]
MSTPTAQPTTSSTNVNPPATVHTLPPAARPNQGKFSKAESTFLDSYLPAFNEYCQSLREKAAGPRMVKGVKGDKKDWILTHVKPKYIQHFNSNGSDGPNLDSLEEKIIRWFNNHISRNGAAPLPSLTSTIKATKRPRAKNAMVVFEEEKKADIQSLISTEKEKGNPATGLEIYRSSKSKLFSDLGPSERQAYEQKAVDFNQSLQDGPKPEVIFSNQSRLHLDVSDALQSFVGWDWKQHGEVVFFLQGAYRNSEGRLISFTSSIGPKSADVPDFTALVPDFRSGLREKFRSWAGRVLPGKPLVTTNTTTSSSSQTPSIAQGATGSPLLPQVDLDSLELAGARRLLRQFIEASWEFSARDRPSDPVPWNSLREAKLWHELLVDPQPLSHLPSLDPNAMTPRDVYDAIGILADSQNQGKCALEFTLPDNVSNSSEIEEIPDPVPVNGPTAAVFNRMVDETIAREGSLQLESVKFPADNNVATSLISTAIRNVAKAGFLTIRESSSPPPLTFPKHPGDDYSPRELDTPPSVATKSAKVPSASPMIQTSSPASAIPSIPPSPTAPSPMLPSLMSSFSKATIVTDSDHNPPPVVGVNPIDVTPTSKKSVDVGLKGKAKRKRTQNDIGVATAREGDMSNSAGRVAPLPKRARGGVAIPLREQSARLRSSTYKNTVVTIRQRL